jgi:protein-S-isoprenylcysteine O-methyltransferase Ste14
MYLGVLTILLGTALLAGSPLVGAYAVLMAIAFHLRTVLYEEPHLAAQFGESWARYAKAVPRWMPRAKPWSGLQQ